MCVRFFVFCNLCPLCVCVFLCCVTSAHYVCHYLSVFLCVV